LTPNPFVIHLPPEDLLLFASTHVADDALSQESRRMLPEKFEQVVISVPHYQPESNLHYFPENVADDHQFISHNRSIPIPKMINSFMPEISFSHRVYVLGE